MLHSPDGLQYKELSSFVFLRQHFSNNRRENRTLTACIRCPSPIAETRRRALQSNPSLLHISNNSTGEDPRLLALTPCRLTNRYRLPRWELPASVPIAVQEVFSPCRRLLLRESRHVLLSQNTGISSPPLREPQMS